MGSLSTKEKHIVLRFNKQIERESTNIHGDKIKETKECYSYWSKQLFLHTRHLSILDWRTIRSNNYYNQIDSIIGIERDKFILRRVIDYLRKNQ
tara:strand:+ start:1287 stop:1568 length:282 start_codon:yes stop_codon:yes gene_type:complete